MGAGSFGRAMLPSLHSQELSIEQRSYRRSLYGRSGSH